MPKIYFCYNAAYYDDFYTFKPTTNLTDAAWTNITGPVQGLLPKARYNFGFQSADDGNFYGFGGMSSSGIVNTHQNIILWNFFKSAITH